MLGWFLWGILLEFYTDGIAMNTRIWNIQAAEMKSKERENHYKRTEMI